MKKSKMVTYGIIALAMVLAIGTAIGFVSQQQASATIGNGNTGGNNVRTLNSPQTSETANGNIAGSTAGGGTFGEQHHGIS